jgi:hypothetical protein
MAVLTLGTTANNSIAKALPYLPGYGSGMAAADIATLNNAILNDQNRLARVGGAFTSAGQLFIPNRGVLQVLPGDYVGVDTRGWPILLSAETIANGLWVHS